ncbi:sulfotransferase domain-containing protein [Kordiimonas sp.]|uniref:sulfotransferase domain-containing protein n=1 Tax=Kordiimonas sp. TaxID=1970157 RepID=UPI003A95D424
MVSFIVAGVQKAGTTALFSFLSKHPEIFLPARKEVHFFDNENLDWSRPSYDAFENIFASKTEAQIAGEVTPIYTYWPTSAERIQAYNPAMKIIVCLRNPVNRAFSHWGMEVTRGWDSLPFPEAIRNGRSRVTGEIGPQYNVHRVFSYVERGFYGPQIKRLLRFFPREQLLFIRNTWLRNDMNKTLNKITDFLGTSRFDTYPVARRVVPVPKTVQLAPLAEADRQYLKNLYHEDIELTEALTGLDLSDWK